MNHWQPQKPLYIFCSRCSDKAWISPDHELHHKLSGIDSIDIRGVHVIDDFISTDEEKSLIESIDSSVPWVESQEGRRKQDYGPKISFIRRKVSVGDFGGFPNFAMHLFDRMQTNHPDIMDGFVPVELCMLEYTPERGSYIRPHFDDTWIWGDRLITVNLLSETALRLTKQFKIPPYEIIIKMPARSLIVIQGEARYDWHHSINKYDIKSRRVAITWREFGDQIINDENYQDFVHEVFAIASQSQTHEVRR